MAASVEARRMAAAIAATVCLSFTCRLTRAESSHVGPEVRAGTTVGFADLDGQRLTTLGGHAALGYTLGRLTLEASYDSTDLLRYDYHSNHLTGTLVRSGVGARLVFLEHRPRANSSWSIRLFAQLDAGRQRIELDEVRHDRTDAGVGTGWIFDYDYERRRGALPIDSLGWHLGWRLTASDNAPSPLYKCSSHCPGEMDAPAALTLGFSSSLWVQF